MPDETTTAQEAKAALGVMNTGLLTGDAFWVDILKQDYQTYRSLALRGTAMSEGRRNYAIAAHCADMLSRYYQREGDARLAQDWAARASRLARIAGQRNNSIVSNISGTMP